MVWVRKPDSKQPGLGDPSKARRQRARSHRLWDVAARNNRQPSDFAPQKATISEDGVRATEPSKLSKAASFRLRQTTAWQVPQSSWESRLAAHSPSRGAPFPAAATRGTFDWGPSLLLASTQRTETRGSSQTQSSCCQPLGQPQLPSESRLALVLSQTCFSGIYRLPSYRGVQVHRLTSALATPTPAPSAKP
jgi:hypothetical protein